MAEASARHVMQIKSNRQGFTTVTLDGHELENVKELYFRAQPERVVVELTFQHVEVEIETEVGEPKVVTRETTESYENRWR